MGLVFVEVGWDKLRRRERWKDLEGCGGVWYEGTNEMFVHEVFRSVRVPCR